MNPSQVKHKAIPGRWRLRELAPPVVALVVALSIGLGLVAMRESNRRSDLRLEEQRLLAHSASEIERRLLSSAVLTHVLAGEVVHTAGDIEDFEMFAASILKKDKFIDHLRLEPNGIVERIYPLNGNEGDLGQQIFLQDDRLSGAVKAIQTRDLVIDGPFALPRGGNAVIVRNPVFLPSGENRISREDQFWGYTAALIHVDKLLNSTGLARISQEGYGYRISSEAVDIESLSETRTLVLSERNLDTDNIRSTIDVQIPSGTWQLTISARAGWISPILALEAVLAVLFALVAAMYCWRIAAEPVRLRKLVSEQTVRLHKLAYQDHLTGLANRNQFMTSIEDELSSGRSTVLMLLDLDHFKEVNDTLGHDVGDELLCAASQRILECLPDSALLARLGGDEFTALFRGEPKLSAVIQAAEAVVDALNKPFFISGNDVRISSSVGVAASNQQDDDVTRLLKRADQAMYRAKNAGRARLSVFTAEMAIASEHRDRLTADLQNALRNKELELAFQPIYCARQHVIHKAEALLRWNHPELGMIGPNEFIPLAEESGLIQEIGNWVFEEVARTTRDWRAQYVDTFQVSVNVSPSQFGNKGTVQHWCNTVDDLGIARDSVLIEITENVLLDGTKTLDTLNKAGFPVALDDFGTGYCSLLHLKELSIDYLKIDRSFVHQLHSDANDAALYRAIIALARQFNLKVIAQGVETPEQNDLLIAEDCDCMQGYLYSRPLLRSEFEAAHLAGASDQVA